MAATAKATNCTKTDDVIASLSRINELLASDRQDVVDAATALLSAMYEENKRLSEQVRWLTGKPYRPSREKVAPGQMAFELLQMLSGVDGKTSNAPAATVNEELDSEPDAEPADDAPAKKRKKRKRRGRDLPRQVVDNRLEESQRCCLECDGTKVEIGFDKQERFIYEPAKVYILEERCYKYACQKGCGGVEQSLPSVVPKPIAGSMASSSFLAYLIVCKLLDGLPIERIAKRLRRHGVDLATSTLNDWIAYAGQMFALLSTRFHKELLRSSLVSLDDTPMPTRSRGHPKGIFRGRQWIYLGDMDRVAYAEFTPDWKGVHPRRALEGFGGNIQGDGYAGINPLFVGDGAPKRVGCNDHARRKFVQALEQRDSRAQPVIDIYRALYRVEADAKAAGDDAVATLARRRVESAPLWKQLEDAVAKLSTTVAKKSPLGKAVIYWNRQQPTLRAYLEQGNLPISNAHVERQIRTVALFRKNSLFYGSADAGAHHAVLLTLLLNCVLVGINPHDYLLDVIDKIATDWPAARVDELMPRNWLQARQREQQSGGDIAAEAA